MSTLKRNLNKLVDTDKSGTKGLGAPKSREPLAGGAGSATGDPSPEPATSGVSGPLTVIEATGKEFAIKDKDDEVIHKFVEWSSYEVRDGKGNVFTLDPNLDGRTENIDPYVP